MHERTIRPGTISTAWWSVVLLLLTLNGCGGAKTESPPAPVPPPHVRIPDAWEVAATDGITEGASNVQTWWKALGDSTLDGLIERAEASNLDIQIAMSRIDQSRSQLGIAKGLMFPDVGLAATASRRKLSDNGALAEVTPPGGFQARSLYSVGVDAAWEIDVFGRIRGKIGAARAGYEAQIEDYRDVLVTLLAEVGIAYVEVRTAQQRIAYAEENAQEQRDTVTLTRERFEAGLTSELDVVQAEANLAGTLAEIPGLENDLVFALNRLAVLLGVDPGTLDDELRRSNWIPSPPRQVATGLPADLLRQRPDIRAAERSLAEQTARVGVAKADLYPSLGLTGYVALSADEVSRLGDSESATWSVDLPIRWTAFDGGELRSRVKERSAVEEQALLAYERTVLEAFEEVDNAISAYTREQVKRSRWDDAVTASQRAVNLARVQYRTGLSDFQTVLDAERTLFRQQDQLAISEGQVVINLITLYKALGGGWSPGDAASQ